MSHKLNTKIRRWINKVIKFHRPASFPFLTGDTFRSLCNHFYDEVSSVDANKVNDRDLIFVRNIMLDDFFKDIHPKIKSRYILISHNDDEPVDDKYISFIEDEKVIRWFALNTDISHPKVTPIPIGLNNFFYDKDENIKIITELSKNKVIKCPEIVYGFNTHDYQTERVEAKRILSDIEIAKYIGPTDGQRDYYKKIQGNMFIASPKGNGIDCFRTWEALYLGIIPIVKKSVLADYFYSIGIPLHIVNEWGDLKGYNSDKLQKIFEFESAKLNNLKQLWMPYWQEQIFKSKYE